MVPESEVKAEGHHKSGHQLLDLVLAGSALFISLCSLGLAIHSGRMMERLVEANSRPELMFESGDLNSEEDPREIIHFDVENPGAGYARVEWLKVAVRGQEVRSWGAALRAVRDRVAVSGSQAVPDLPENETVNSTLSRTYVKPGSTRRLFSWPRTEQNAALWEALNKARGEFDLTACYCSIFDECWVARSASSRGAGWPVPVKSCAVGRPAEITGEL